jgi:hypothetical protein
MGEILDPAGREVVQDPDFRPFCDEMVDEMGADEPGSAGYERSRQTIILPGDASWNRR